MATDLTALAGSVFVKTTLTSKKPSDLSVVSDPLTYQVNEAVAFGDAAGQCDQIFHDQRTLIHEQEDHLNLISGDLLNPFGLPAAFAVVKAVIIRNLSAVASLKIGAAGGDQAKLWFGTDACYETIAPGGTSIHLALVVGWAVGGGESDFLVTNLDLVEDATYDIIIVGVSTA